MYEKINHIVHVATNIGTSCKHCSESVGIEHFTSGVNHYITAHGYKLLHVGQQTEHATDGGLWHSTVAVLGTESADEGEKDEYPPWEDVVEDLSVR